MPIDLETFRRGEERYSIENEIIQFLHDNKTRAFNVHEITDAVMDIGWSEANVEETADCNASVGWVLDMATVSSVLDEMVDHGGVERRIVDTGDGPRSYYRAK